MFNFIGFFLNSLVFFSISMDFIQFHLSFLNFFELFRVSLDLSQFLRIFPSFFGFFSISLDFSEFLSISSIFTGLFFHSTTFSIISPKTLFNSGGESSQSISFNALAFFSSHCRGIPRHGNFVFQPTPKFSPSSRTNKNRINRRSYEQFSLCLNLTAKYFFFFIFAGCRRELE